MRADNDIWVAGNQGVIAHWGGNGWSVYEVGNNYNLSDIAMLSADYGWAFGRDDSSGYGAIFLWNGLSWMRSNGQRDSNVPTKAFFLSPQSAWGIGAFSILYSGAGAWRNLGSPTTGQLSGLALNSAGDGWIVGHHGIRLRYVPFGNWTYLPLVSR